MKSLVLSLLSLLLFVCLKLGERVNLTQNILEKRFDNKHSIVIQKDLTHLLSTYSEVLYEDETFRSRAFAALVASKVFYHLGAFEESLNYALGAGELFNVTDDSEYVETIIGE